MFRELENDGTLVIIYNLKLGGDGLSEFDFETDPEDIQMRHFNLNPNDPK